MANKTERVEEGAADDTPRGAARSTQTLAKHGVDRLADGLGEAAEFGHSALEAVVESSKIATRAHQEAGAEMLAFTRRSVHDSLAAAREIGAAHTVREALDRQATFSRKFMEGALAEAARIGDLYAAATRDAFQPIATRLRDAAAGAPRDTV